jgi:uncharacterized protein DUF5916
MTCRRKDSPEASATSSPDIAVTPSSGVGAAAVRFRRLVPGSARRVLWLLLAFVALLAAVSNAQTPALPPAGGSLTIPRVEQAPSIEDYLDGTPRPQEAAVTTFYQREPGDGVPVSQPTEAYLSYDDHNLYVIFVAHDDPAAVRATLTRREGFGNDDFVGLVLDSFGDRQRAYLFLVNPLGVQQDGVSAEGQHDDDYSYDTVWHSEGRLTSFGYVVWMAIPFKSLRFPNQPEQHWRLALARAIRRNNETSFWPYLTRRIASMGQQLAPAGGVANVSPGRNIQVIPYVAGAGARFLDVPRPAYDTDADLRGGIDGKMVIKDAFTLDLTFNPDFSQVESDEPQVTINQRFEVFFPEKRPFFIENASYFESPIQLFFSRRIADPQAGARLTGKKAGWAIAALAIDDRAPGRLVEPGGPASGDRTGIGVVRVQRELPNQSTLGLLATTWNFGASESRVVSVDGRYKMSDTLVLTGQAAASSWRPLDGSSISGPAISLNLDRTGRNWGAFLSYDDVSRDFRAPLGFVRRTDLRQVHPFFRYTFFPEKGALVSFRPEISGLALWDHSGTLQDWEFNSENQVELKGQTELEFELGESMERFAGVEFRKHRRSARFSTAWLKWLEAGADLQRENAINFFPAGGLAPFLANGSSAELTATVKPIAPLRVDQTYLFTRLSARESRAGAPSGAVIVDNHILRTRASYQFTRALSLRAIVDYSAVLPDERLIALDREKRFAADFLMTYLVNPWTAFYVGYTDGYANVEIDPLSRDRLRLTDSPFHSAARQVFVKMSYLFRF